MIHWSNKSLHKLSEMLEQLSFAIENGFALYSKQEGEDLDEINKELNRCVTNLWDYLKNNSYGIFGKLLFKKNKAGDKIITTADFYEYLKVRVRELKVEAMQARPIVRQRFSIHKAQVVQSKAQDIQLEPVQSEEDVQQSSIQIQESRVLSVPEIPKLEKSRTQMNQEMPDAWDPSSENYYKGTLRIFDKRKFDETFTVQNTDVDFKREKTI